MVQFSLAAHEPGQAPMCRHLQPGPQRAEAQDLVDIERLGDSLDLNRPQCLEIKVSIGQSICRFAHQDGRERGHRLHPGCNVNRMPHRVVVGTQVVLADRADHHFARVNANPNLQCNTPFQANTVGMAAHRVLHA
ncbi:hypothetical protein D3C86_1656790 [compost metagenome]